MSEFSFSDWARLDAARPALIDSVNAGVDRARKDDAYRRSRDALERVRANPNDRQALTDLAVYDPVAAEAFRKANEDARIRDVRTAASNVVRYGNVMGPRNGSPSPIGRLAGPQGAPSPLESAGTVSGYGGGSLRDENPDRTFEQARDNVMSGRGGR